MWQFNVYTKGQTGRELPSVPGALVCLVPAIDIVCSKCYLFMHLDLLSILLPFAHLGPILTLNSTTPTGSHIDSTAGLNCDALVLPVTWQCFLHEPKSQRPSKENPPQRSPLWGSGQGCLRVSLTLRDIAIVLGHPQQMEGTSLLMKTPYTSDTGLRDPWDRSDLSFLQENKLSWYQKVPAKFPKDGTNHCPTQFWCHNNQNGTITPREQQWHLGDN